MTRSAARSARKPATRQDNTSRATTVFRDFVRQLEKLDAKPPKAARGAAR
ncbi:hypothetical protein [Microvirga splendida]|uniref:Uncharacterized protein n=1 Tax=Microvirga splendida TaxID=2795727 RepID=A0ABS0Y1M6_9HYPH|nr:hypothetical protein [Microvirga splendida]MBJ6126204.1 hypothetical protein [Microvirga splendida]